MKLSCHKQQLLKIINTVQKAVSSKSIMPILECIKIDADASGNITGRSDSCTWWGWGAGVININDKWTRVIL